jgi:hypothetical protein
MTALLIPSLLSLAGALLFAGTAHGQSWPQWALDPQHTGNVSISGQMLNNILQSITYDPLVPQEMAANQNNLLAHYQVPLIDGGNIYMEFKSGTYNKNRYSTEIWGENGFRWQNGQLVQIWSFTSDWQAAGSQADFWEPVFHAVLANGFIYVPGAGGTLFKLDTSTGAVVTRINPFGGKLDPTIIVAGVPTTDGNGNIYYNAIQQYNPGTGISFYQHDIVDSWLLKVTAGDSAAKVSYSLLVASPAPGSLPSPQPNDPCLTTFTTKDLPFPPSATALPTTTPCGTMRPALNAAPAIGSDGTIYTVTRAHLLNGDRYAGIAAVHPDLTSKWWTSMRDRLNDGCNNDSGTFAGALLPANGTPGGCRLGSTPGVDPAQNTRPGARVLDDSSSSITVTPDGSILYGAYTRYDFARGHLMRFGSAGQFLGAYSFGWDSTPAIYRHGGTYSIVIKDNEYGGGPQFGSYCNVDAICPPRNNGPFYITQLDPNLNVEWKFKNTNNQDCTRNADGSITCVPNTSGNQWQNLGFEWCINAPVVDRDGIVYANSEDGNLYAITQGGTLKQNIFLDLALGAAYTPLAIGQDGRIYTENKGTLFIIGQ